jgi:amino acid adenylation domain-containing protein
MSQTQKLIADLSPRKLALLSKKLKETATTPARERITPRANKFEPCPLSFAQQRLWFMDQLEPGRSVYSMPGAMRLIGELDVAALEQSIREIVRRHEALRTSFMSERGEPMQVVSDQWELDLPVMDLRHLAEDERVNVARRVANERAQLAFDLSRGLLFRVELLRVAAQDHVLIVNMHHIVSDEWSMGVLVRELTALYAAYSRGEESPLEELEVQYADFALWQRRRLQGAPLKQQLAYWKRNLAGLEPLEFPTDYPRPAAPSHRGGMLRFSISTEVTSQLMELSRREGVTPFMVLLAAFQLLCGRCSGQEDVAVGTDVANRNQAEIEVLIGFFVNQLVMRTNLGGAPSFIDLLGRVREATLGAYVHQDLPFGQLVEELSPRRELSRAPLFQVKLVLQNAPQSDLKLGGLSLQGMDIEYRQARFDLVVFMREINGELAGVMDYASDLFEAGTVERLIGRLRLVLEQVVAAPFRRVSDLDLLAAGERRQILYQWNDTSQPYPDQACAHELFIRQVEKTPQAIAVVQGSRELSYEQLDRSSNHLASYLQNLGVGPEVKVAVYMNRGLEQVIAILGILKAGGAYVPMDPSYPLERLAYILQDIQAPVVLTEESLQESLPSSWSIVVCLDRDWSEITARYGDTPMSAGRPENLAYIIYTSGSTGRPKGVMVTHRGLTNYLCWAAAAYNIVEGRGTVVHSPISFDLTVTSLFVPLIAGQSVELLPEGHSVEDLAATLRARGDLSLVKATPAHLEGLSQYLGTDEVRGLSRAFVIGGEALSWDQVAFWRRYAPDSRLINEYGPTETVVGCTSYEVGESGTANGAIPIGRPIANTQIYILDKEMRPAPIGVMGEIYIGGAGVARGYMGEAGLTASSFIANPFGGESGGRLYKTGDLGRYLADKNIEYVGRSDHQVKLRGYRIELGEIEAALSGCAGVRQAVVVAREDDPGSKRLVAYLVSACPSVVGGQELRRYLKSKLPEYMAPSAYVWMDAIPLTANGKVDRKGLPKPESVNGGGVEKEGDYQKPCTPIEEMLATIWGELLRLETVGASQNFFELGGHSLLATQVASRIREVFGVEVALRCIFEHPTVKDLAAAVESAMRAGEGSEAPPIKPVSRNRELPLSFAQQRLWFMRQLDPDSTAYNIYHALRVKGALNFSALHQSLNTIMARHEALRTRFEARDGQPAQVIDERGEVNLLVCHLGNVDEDERERLAKHLAEQGARRPFDLERGPVWRATLAQLSAEDHVLLLCMHHVVSDGWSAGILSREFAVLYEEYSKGQSAILPDLPIQYADFAVWQREWLQGETLERHLGYWRNQLSGAPTLDLPTDRPRSIVARRRGAEIHFGLSSEITEQLKRISRREGATLFMTLMAGFKIVLGRYTGQEDLLIGTDVANRNRLETEGLIGFFVNQLALRTDLSGDPSFREILRRVRRTVLDAYGCQDVPFEKVVDEVAPARRVDRSPLFQVKLVLQNVPSHDLHSSDLTISSLSVDDSTSKFDILLNILETAEGLVGYNQYDSDLFDRSTMQGLLRFYEAALSVIATGDASIDLPKSALLQAVNQRAGSLLTQKVDLRAYLRRSPVARQL